MCSCTVTCIFEETFDQMILTKRRCKYSCFSGATGIAQAMTLSFGGLQFSAGLFEFAANPASLHTSVTFRHIHLYKDVYINVSVIINDHTGHAEKLLITANLGDDKRLYACEAGCQFEPVELGYVVRPIIICFHEVRVHYNHVKMFSGCRRLYFQCT